MDLVTAAAVADIVGALVVVGGVTYGIAEWRELRRKRVDLAALQIVHSFQSPEWIDALRIVWRLPDDASPREVSADPEIERAAVTVGTYLHTIGFMVRTGTMPMDVLREFQTGTPLVAWRKLRVWVKAIERRAGHPSFRWFEWLALELGGEPVAQRPADAGRGA